MNPYPYDWPARAAVITWKPAVRLAEAVRSSEGLRALANALGLANARALANGKKVPPQRVYAP